MNHITEPHQPHYRVEFYLAAPDADYEPSDDYLRFDTHDAAAICMKHPPTHIRDKRLNYNYIHLLHVDYEDADQDSWFVKHIEHIRICHPHDRFEDEYQDWDCP